MQSIAYMVIIQREELTFDSNQFKTNCLGSIPEGCLEQMEAVDVVEIKYLVCLWKEALSPNLKKLKLNLLI